jgi:serine O-acetyltransferase
MSSVAAPSDDATGTPESDAIRVAPPATLSGILADLLIHTRERKGRPIWRYALELLYTLVLSTGFHMMLVWRLGAFCHKLHLLPLSILAEKIVYHWYHCCIPCSVKIGPGMWVPHPLGIVFASRARLGRGVWIRQNVQIVHVWEGTQGQTGVVGDYAQLHTSAILIKGAVIGHQAVVAAGTLVNRPVPPLHMAMGSPARVKPLRPEQVPSTAPRHV